MRVLVTGGTGVIGEGVIPALLNAGHKIRLLTRSAEDDAKEWPESVEPFKADVSKSTTLRGAADACDACIHITGIVNESPPRVTFESINVNGTKNILKEASRARVRRFIYISSLGADRGSSAYHQSKRRAEELVREFKGDWLILRPGGVYGPGDEVISTLLKLIRTLPLIPVIDGGDQRFQPIWFEDVGAAVASALEMDELAGQTLELAGAEVTTMNDVLDRLSSITDRSPARIPVPSFLAAWGTQLFEGNSLGSEIKRLTGLDVPADEAKLTMLLEENFISESEPNGLVDTLGIEPVPLDEGLKALADLLPEQTIDEGVGKLERKRFYADIERSRYDAPELLEQFRKRLMQVMPLEFSAEPGASLRVEKGATLTASIPLRGNIQVRVEELTPRRITFVTLEGHPLAGVVQFKTSALKQGRVRFMIEIHARQASIFDRLTMSLGGSLMQNLNWQEVVERVVDLSRGSAPLGVESESVTLEDDEAEKAERMVARLVKRFKRAEKHERVESGKRLASASAKSRKGKSSTERTRTAQRNTARVAPASKTTRAKESGERFSWGGSKKRTPDGRAGRNVADAIDAVSQAASTLVGSVSAAALNLTRAATKKGLKKQGR
jgi:uncharacterized protein YbjT (DUF2867 family)